MNAKSPGLLKLLREGAPAVVARMIRKGKSWLQAKDFVEKQWGAAGKENWTPVSNLSQQIISSAVALGEGIAQQERTPFVNVPVIQGFDPDPDGPGRWNYEVIVPWENSDGREGRLFVRITSDSPLSPVDVEAEAWVEAGFIIINYEDRFGGPSDLDDLNFGTIEVLNIFRTF